MMSIDATRVQWRGYFPGAIGKIIELHAVYYYEHWGFDISFETQVGRELAEFMERFDAQTDGFWTGTVDGRLVGSVAIDGGLAQTLGARLRWLIVDPCCHRTGMGRNLVGNAIKLCRNVGHQKVFLWTFRGLDPARSVYEQAGFLLTEEHDVEQWGQRIREQKFELVLA
jgi:N-acetylglutamate synthase-like GNAT family acetyltransferase